MSDYTQFEATTPDIVAATSEVTYDKFWLKNFRIQAHNPQEAVKAVATFVPARDVTIDVEGEPVVVKEVNPNGQQKKVVIEDLFAEAEGNADLKAALESVLAVLKTIGTDQGVF